jgi:uncharacterized cupredoxin-like copper-binding protein
MRLTRRVAILLCLGVAGCAAPAPIEAPRGAAEGLAGVDWAHAETVTLSLSEFAFSPTSVTLRAGQPVRLRLVNAGNIAHNFTSPDLFRSVALRPEDGTGARVLASGGSVEVPAGQTRELLLVPLSPGRHAFECTHPLHATLGMRGEVVVAG